MWRTGSPIEQLEPRRMLTAVISGTSGNDVMRVSVQGIRVTVDVNGTVEEVEDTIVTVDGVGGNDTIILDQVHALHQINFATVLIEGGNGDDVIRMGNSVLANFQTNDQHFALEIRGQGGEDTLEMNFLDATEGRSVHFQANRVQFGNGAIDASFFYLDDLEHCELDGTAFVDGVSIFAKPAPLRVVANGQGGNDLFNIGNGDLIDNQLFNSTTLSGGAGSDSVVFRDSSSGAPGVYTLDTFTLNRDSNTLTYSTFETITLETDDRIIGGVTTPNTVNVNGINGSAVNTTIRGASAAAPHRGNIVNVGNGNLSNIPGTLTVRECTAANLIDSAVAGPRTYIMTSAGMTFPRPINLINCAAISVNGSLGNDAFLIRGLAAGSSLTANGNSGGDGFFLGLGDISADLLGPVSVSGGTGTDQVTFDNSLDASLATQTLRATSLTENFAHGYSSVEQLTINEGPAGTNLTVNSVSVATTLNGGNGNDNFTIGGGDIDANFPVSTSTSPAVLINGSGGTDAIHFNDLNDDDPDNYIFQRPNGVDQFQKDDTNEYFFNWSGVEGVTLDASNSAQVGSFCGLLVIDLLTPLRLNGNAGSDLVEIRDAAAPVLVATGSGAADQLKVNTDFGTGDAPVTVVIDQSDEVETLEVRSGGTVRVTNGATLVKNRLAQFPGNLVLAGDIDLAGGSFLSRAGGPTIATFRTWVGRGYNNGNWDGIGTGGAINSSLAAGSSPTDAVGYGLGSDIAVSSIDGINIAAGDTLVRYTFYGDTDLNQSVDFDDYVRTDAGFNTSRTSWTNGDFDFNNSIDFDDYVLIDLGFNRQ